MWRMDYKQKKLWQGWGHVQLGDNCSGPSARSSWSLDQNGGGKCGETLTDLECSLDGDIVGVEN